MPVMYAKTLKAAEVELTKIGYVACVDHKDSRGPCFRRVDRAQGIDNHVVIERRNNKIYLEDADVPKQRTS